MIRTPLRKRVIQRKEYAKVWPLREKCDKIFESTSWPLKDWMILNNNLLQTHVFFFKFFIILFGNVINGFSVFLWPLCVENSIWKVDENWFAPENIRPFHFGENGKLSRCEKDRLDSVSQFFLRTEYTIKVISFKVEFFFIRTASFTGRLVHRIIIHVTCTSKITFKLLRVETKNCLIQKLSCIVVVVWF